MIQPYEETSREDVLATEEKRQKVEREINDHKKVIQQIESSKTWRASKGYRHIKQLLANNEKVEKQALEAMMLELETALFKAEEQIDHLKLKDTEQTTQKIYEQMREMKNQGKLISFLDTMIQDKRNHQQNYREALVYAARLYMQAETADQKLLYEKILSGLTIEEIPEFMIRAGLDEEAIPLQQAASFRGSLNMRMRKKQLQTNLPEWPLDDKRKAYNFVESLDIPTPNVEAPFYTVDTLPVQEGIVIKPADGAGARGVYLVHTVEDIFDVKKSSTLSGWSELVENMYKDLQTGAVTTDAWLVEQLIYENKATKIPARDIKFYCFYGKVGMVLEIKRDPEVRQCWWTPTGERTDTGKYEESLFHGLGVSAEEIAMVEKMSSEIPAPFLRIDFLRGEDGLIFGEFTPKPGNYDEFNERTDQQLGDYFLDAEARLVDDLLQGKQFQAYKQFVQDMGMIEA